MKLGRLKDLMFRSATRGTHAPLVEKEIAGLVQGVCFKGNLDCAKDGHGRAGLAVQEIAAHIDEFYNGHGYESRIAKSLIRPVAALGAELCYERCKCSDDPKGVPVVLLNSIIDRRAGIYDMLESRTNFMCVLRLDDETHRKVREVAGFAQGMNDIARTHKIGPFVNPEFRDDHEDMIEWILKRDEPSAAQPQVPGIFHVPR